MHKSETAGAKLEISSAKREIHRKKKDGAAQCIVGKCTKIKLFVNKDGGWRDEDQLCEEEIPGAKLGKEIENITRPDALRPVSNIMGAGI